MERIIAEQRVTKRKPNLPQPVREPRMPRRSLEPIAVSGRIKGIIRGLDPVLWYTTGILLLLCAVLFLATAIRSSGTTMQNEGFDLPPEAGIETLMYEYLAPPPAGGADAPAAAPSGSLRTSVEPRVYVIKPGDTVSAIAEAFKLRDDTIISYNGVRDVRRIAAGTVLQIPSVDGVAYTVRPGDTLSGIANRHGVPLNPLLDINDLDSDLIRPGDELFIPEARMNETDLKRALGTLFIKPTRGLLASGFGMRKDPFTGIRRMHNGIDWANSVGTAVWASNRGRVLRVGEDRTYGRYVILEHSGNYQTLYAHLERAVVRVGQWVEQEQKIGEIGTTGRSTGPHLHFSIYRNAVALDPLEFVN